MIKFTKEESYSKLIDVQEISTGIWRQRYFNPFLAQKAKPGQFVHISLFSKDELSNDLLLRRPISLSKINREENWIEIIFRDIGRGTKKLSKLLVGNELSIVGPLGKGFSLSGKKILLIGGGLGIAPLIFLSEEHPAEKILIGLGVRTHTDLFWVDQFAEGLKKEIIVASDDGSVGYKGSIVGTLDQIQEEFDMVYTCGPAGLMKAVAKWATGKNIECEVSLEERMACGVGVCQACGCNTSKGRRRVCLNGPVFSSKEVYQDD